MNAAGAMRLAVIGDSQHAVCDHPAVWDAQCAWLAAMAPAPRELGAHGAFDTPIARTDARSMETGAAGHGPHDSSISSPLNAPLRAVLHVGDVVQRNTLAEWRIAAAGLRRLERAGLPVYLTLGNHDFGERGKADDRTTHALNVLGEDFARRQPGYLEAFETGGLDNCLYRVPGHRSLHVLTLELATRPAVLAWARAALEAHRCSEVIVLTHAALYRDGSLYDAVLHDDARAPRQKWRPQSYGLWAPGCMDAGDLWRAFFSKTPAVRAIFCGHAVGLATPLVHLVREAPLPPVDGLLTNYQDDPEGGAGFTHFVTLPPGADPWHYVSASSRTPLQPLTAQPHGAESD